MTITPRRLIAKYYPYIFFGCIILLFVFMVNLKDKNQYTNRKYKYSVRFPDGWIRDDVKPRAVSYIAPDRLPVSDVSEAALTIVIDERYGEIDLNGHFNILVRDLVQTGAQILNNGVGYVGREPSLWVEFTDANGLEHHVWYVLFNRTNKLLIIQYRVASDYIEQYRSAFKKFLESYK